MNAVLSVAIPPPLQIGMPTAIVGPVTPDGSLKQLGDLLKFEGSTLTFDDDE